MSGTASAVAQLNARCAQALLAACARGRSAAQPRYVVLSPGSRSTPLVLACAASASFAKQVVLDERAAAFFALGLARATQQTVVLICTSGSAVAHYLPAVIEAHHSDVPLLVISADRPSLLHHCGAPQTIEQASLLQQQTRYKADLEAPLAGDAAMAALRVRQWQSHGALALAASQAPRPGPVHLNVAFHEPLWLPEVVLPASAPAPASRVLRVWQTRPQPAAARLQAYAATWRRVARGVLVCGPQALQQRWGATLQALAAQLGWPLLAEPCAWGASPPARNAADPPAGPGVCSLGIRCSDAMLRDAGLARALRPKQVLRLGALPTSKAVNRWLQAAAAPTCLVSASGVCSDPSYQVQTLEVCSPEDFCTALLQSLQKLPSAPPRRAVYQAAWARAAAAAAAALETFCAQHFFAGSVVRHILAQLPATTLLSVGNSMVLRDVDSFAPRHSPLREILCSRGANGIDGGIASLLGTALARRPQPVVGLLGDLAFLHDVGALQLARQAPRGLGALLIVLNNQGGAIFETLPIQAHADLFATYFRTPQVADIQALCAAAHVAYQRVDTAASLQATLPTCLAAMTLQSRLHVLEVVLPARQAAANQALYTAAWQAAQQASRAALKEFWPDIPLAGEPCEAKPDAAKAVPSRSTAST